MEIVKIETFHSKWCKEFEFVTGGLKEHANVMKWIIWLGNIINFLQILYFLQCSLPFLFSTIKVLYFGLLLCFTKFHAHKHLPVHFTHRTTVSPPEEKWSRETLKEWFPFHEYFACSSSNFLLQGKRQDPV